MIHLFKLLFARKAKSRETTICMNICTNLDKSTKSDVFLLKFTRDNY